MNPFWFQLWSKEDIDEMNRNYQISDNLPNYIGFGSNGGDELLVFNSKGQIFAVPFIPMNIDEAMKISESWSDFMNLMI